MEKKNRYIIPEHQRGHRPPIDPDGGTHRRTIRLTTKQVRKWDKYKSTGIRAIIDQLPEQPVDTVAEKTDARNFCRNLNEKLKNKKTA